MAVIKKIKTLILLNILFGNMLFFAINVFVGYQYDQIEGWGFKVYLVTSSILVYLMIAESLIKGRIETSYLLPCLTVLVLGLFSLRGVEFTEFSKKQFFLFLIYAPTCSYAGFCFSNKNRTAYVDGFILIIAVLISVSSLMSLKTMLQLGVVELNAFYGGGQYQAYSYFAAVGFLVTFARYLKSDSLSFLSIFVYCLMQIIILLGIYLSGGRGGLVVVLAGGVFFSVTYRKNFNRIAYIILLIVVSVAIFALRDDVELLVHDYMTRILNSFDRLTSFVGEGVFNIDGLSNREYFYLKAAEIISENPISGFGIFGVSNRIDEFYAHNLFLDILMQGGVIYLILCLIFFVQYIPKVLNRRPSDSCFDLFFCCVIHSAVMLNVSSCYLIEPLFWFAIGYIISVQKDLEPMVGSRLERFRFNKTKIFTVADVKIK